MTIIGTILSAIVLGLVLAFWPTKGGPKGD